MVTNYVSDYVGKLISLLNKTNQGNYSECGSAYHLLISSYNELMNSIDNNELSHIKKAKQNFIEEIERIQEKYIKKAWAKYYPIETYPKQISIHGINIVIEILLDEERRLNNKYPTNEK